MPGSKSRTGSPEASTLRLRSTCACASARSRTSRCCLRARTTNAGSHGAAQSEARAPCGQGARGRKRRGASTGAKGAGEGRAPEDDAGRCCRLLRLLLHRLPQQPVLVLEVRQPLLLKRLRAQHEAQRAQRASGPRAVWNAALPRKRLRRATCRPPKGAHLHGLHALLQQLLLGRRARQVELVVPARRWAQNAKTTHPSLHAMRSQTLRGRRRSALGGSNSGSKGGVGGGSLTWRCCCRTSRCAGQR